MVFSRNITLLETMDPSLHLPKGVSLLLKDGAEFCPCHFAFEAFHEEKLEHNWLFDLVDLMDETIFR
jgi:hypothetical protein